MWATANLTGKTSTLECGNTGWVRSSTGYRSMAASRVYGSTFFVFSDYMRPPIRLAALMRQPVIYVFTHDSFYVGEDGPTHQPVEHIEALRIIPGMRTIRPADANETA